MNRPILRAVLVVIALAASSLHADVKPASVFSDHAVLQRGKPLPVWGTADPGEAVTVTLAGHQATATADEQGRWRVELPALEAGGEALEMTIAGKNTVAIKDLLVGDVWLCSGQSNMEWDVARTRDAEQEIAAANYPQIRLLTVPKYATGAGPRTDQRGRWTVCSPETVAKFSAVGYFFGRHLHRELGVPIGLINSSWGGTPAEAWTSLEALQSSEVMKPAMERYAKAIEEYPQAQARYQEALAKWEAEGKTGQRPRAPQGRDHYHAPAALYNGMIHPLVPYALKGAIWYQGETNAGRAEAYRTLLPLMINDWRQRFGQGDFPFLVVQLANFRAPATRPAEPSDWAELRDAQLFTASTLPNVGLAVAIDIGEAKDIHPRNKQDVGRRLALAAEKIAYGRDVVHTGPTLREMKIDGGQVVLAFDSAAGLKAQDPSGTGRPLPFALAGEDQVFHPADARIEGDRVILSSSQVPAPVAVRYAWSNNPDSALLYNDAGLPASPFRTDDWPYITAGKR